MTNRVGGRPLRSAVLLSVLLSGAVAAQEAWEPAATSDEVFYTDEAPAASRDGDSQSSDASLDLIDVEPLRPADAEPEAAQEAAPAVVDTVQVTGSRIRRTDYETSQPVVVVSREDIDRTGLANIGDLLQELPAAGSALNRQFNNGGAGTTEIELRNLGSQRVLVLVDGHRWVGGTSFSNLAAVDLNTIPVSIIERIEVLKDGASAVYGSDAIAGVVNIITKKEFDGVELRAQAGAFDDGEGLQQAYNLSVGTSSGKTSVFFDLSFVRQEALFAGDRSISRDPVFGTGLTRGSIFTPRGTVLFVPNPANGAILGTDLCPSLTADVANGVLAGVFADPAGTVGDPLSPGDLGSLPGSAPQLIDPQVGGVQLCQMILRPDLEFPAITGEPTENTATVRGLYKPYVAGEDAYNYAPINYLLTPFDQTTLFGKATHEFTDALRFNLLLLYNNSRTERNLAETPLLFGNLTFPPYDSVYVDATNRFNPFDQDIGRSGEDGLIGLGIIGRRFVELGPRFLGRDKHTAYARASLEGELDLVGQEFSWDVGYSMGRSTNTNIHRGDLNMERVALALGPDADCEAPCVPLNLFGGPGSITPEMLEYISYEATSRELMKSQDLYANISTLVPVPLLAAPMGIAFGAEYRAEEFAEQPDPFVEAGISSTNIRRRTEGSFSASEAYLEVELPLVRGLPLVEELGLSLAGRYTSYNTFDPATTGKASLRWKPHHSLLARATVSQAFRAPSLTDLYLGEADGYPQLTDPCVNPGAGSAAEQNCAEDGVTDASQLSGQILTRFSGNRDLEPETANSFTAGLVWSPTFVPQLTLTADYFSIRLDDFIANLQPDYILDSCYNTPRESGRPATCDFVVRSGDGSGPIQFIRAASFNFARIETEGLDVGFDYRLPLDDWFDGLGTLRLTFDSQYLTRYDRFLPNPDGSVTEENYAGVNDGDTPFPRVKANLVAAWSFGDWEASWTARFIGHTTEDCNDGFEPSLRDLGLCSHPDDDLEDGTDDSKNRLPDLIYHNVQVGLNLREWQTQIVLGVVNVFDKDPPVSFSAFANSFPSTLYEAPGRQPYLRLVKTF